jgi:putative flippase GtrA
MITFIKAQFALILGSLADFLTTILLVSVFNCNGLIGSAVGNVAGAIVQFIVSRRAFDAEKGDVSKQVMRFVLIWAGNIAVSSAGIYLLLHYCNMDYLVSKLMISKLILSKLIVSIVMGLTYTFILSKKFVFA